MALPPTTTGFPGRPRKRLRFMRGQSSARPHLDLGEPSLDLDGGIFNIGNGTAAPWQYFPATSATPQLLSNKIYGAALPISSGTATALAVSYEALSLTAYQTGLRVLFIAHVGNGANTTLSVAGGPARPLGTKTGTLLPASVLIANGVHEVCYDGTVFRLLL